MIERRICKMTVFCLTVIAPHEICTICHAWFNFNCVHSSLISCNFGLLCCHYGLHELQIYCQINFANTVQCPTLKSVTWNRVLFSFIFFRAFIIFSLFWSYNYMLFPSPTPQSQGSHLSLALQMQSQSETCSEPREAVVDHPETSTQIISAQWQCVSIPTHETLTLLLYISSIHLFQNPPACKFSITQSSCSFREKFFLWCGLCWTLLL